MEEFIVRVINPTTGDRTVMLVRGRNVTSPASAHNAAAALYRRSRRLKSSTTLNTLTLGRKLVSA